MGFIIEAVCGNHIGNVRKKNQDNYFFDGKCRSQENGDYENCLYVNRKIKTGEKFAIFDGMGGENYGEVASYIAAKKMATLKQGLKDCLLERLDFLEKMVLQLNDVVVSAKQQLFTDRMGTTMAMLYFTQKSVYICNVGDSRIYRFRDDTISQLSEDHVERRAVDGKKSPLTRYLGMDSEEIVIEPYLKEVVICKDDMYLICSDGITDMLTDTEIADLLRQNENMKTCVHNFIQAALEKGGRDNITAIVCKVK